MHVKVIGPLGEEEIFEVADFKLLEDFERTTHGDVVHAKVRIHTMIPDPCMSSSAHIFYRPHYWNCQDWTLMKIQGT